jgi:UDP-2,4-diacetamido-2,4,6-trideoxy-beta-L-altropyranose hydrolase
MQSSPELPPLLVRADADTHRGAGHVLRSLALARAWRERGGSVRFVTVRPAPALKQRIQLAGAIVIELDDSYPSNRELTAGIVAQLQQSSGERPWVIVDGYHFDAVYHAELRRAGCEVLVIDDNAHLSRYDADIILNHGIQAPQLDYRAADDTWFLLGTEYALLRADFERWRDFRRAIPPRAKNILVTLGGGDADNVTAKVLEALAQLEDLDLSVQVLIGPLNPHVCALAERAGGNIQLQTDVADTAALMAWADVAIAAGGTTAWELAFMQTPALLLVLAENQAGVAAGIHNFGAAHTLGQAGNLTSADIADALRELISDPTRRQRMAERGRMLVDGRGVERVIAAMAERRRFFSSEDFCLRPAREGDRLLLWQWANDVTVRRNSFHGGAIDWPAHEEWFIAKFASADCRIWIMQIGALPVGQIRYERISSDTAEISFSIARGFRGRQLGTRLLEASAERAALELGVGRIQGAVKLDNEASRRAFLKAGFQGRHEHVQGEACWVFHRAAHGSARREDYVAVH